MEQEDIETLDRLVKSGNINAYHITELGVNIEFIDGTIIEFKAYGGECSSGFIGLELEEKLSLDSE